MPHHHVMHLPDGTDLPKVHPEAIVHWPPGKPPGGAFPKAILGCRCDWCEFRRSPEHPQNRS